MSFYRTLLAAVAAIAIASPVFAQDEATSAPAEGASASAPAAAPTENSTPSSEQGAATTETKVNINKASAKDLMKVKGMNASKARAIVTYRKKHGDFKSLDDLAKVKGFTKMKADDMKAIEDQLTIE